MSNTRLEEQLADQPAEIQDEIIRINTDVRPLALQVALLVPILAGLLGLVDRISHGAPTRPRGIGELRDGPRVTGGRRGNDPATGSASAARQPRGRPRLARAAVDLIWPWRRYARTSARASSYRTRTKVPWAVSVSLTGKLSTSRLPRRS